MNLSDYFARSDKRPPIGRDFRPAPVTMTATYTLTPYQVRLEYKARTKSARVTLLKDAEFVDVLRIGSASTTEAIEEFNLLIKILRTGSVTGAPKTLGALENQGGVHVLRKL